MSGHNGLDCMLSAELHGLEAPNLVPVVDYALYDMRYHQWSDLYYNQRTHISSVILLGVINLPVRFSLGP